MERSGGAVIDGDSTETVESPAGSGLNDDDIRMFQRSDSISRTSAEARLDELRRRLQIKEGRPLVVTGIGAGAWGSVFIALLQERYGHLRDKIDVRIWRRPGKALDKSTAEKLFQARAMCIINSREDVMRRLQQSLAYFKYVDARLGDRQLFPEEVVTSLPAACWDADLLINSLPSPATRAVFSEIGQIWRERSKPPAVIVSLSKGVEAALEPHPHIITPTTIIGKETGVPEENLLYLGGPNIASEVYAREYANARICGADKWRSTLAAFLKDPNFMVWDNKDLVTHEMMGGLKNVYAIGAGIVAAVTNDSATSKSVYFSHCTSEMVFITHLLSPEPEVVAGPLMADIYVTLLKGRNAWYGVQIGSGALSLDDGDMVKGKGLIQGVSAVAAFHSVLSDKRVRVDEDDTDDDNNHQHHEGTQPISYLPILQTLYDILHSRKCKPAQLLTTLRQASDPRERMQLGSKRRWYLPKLLEVPDV
eukprot:jgi/Chlat1/4698/Chrsp3S00443